MYVTLRPEQVGMVTPCKSSRIAPGVRYGFRYSQVPGKKSGSAPLLT